MVRVFGQRAVHRLVASRRLRLLHAEHVRAAFGGEFGEPLPQRRPDAVDVPGNELHARAGLRPPFRMNRMAVRITAAPASVRAFTSSPATAQPRKTATRGLTNA